MSRHRENDTTIGVELSARDRMVCDEMKAAARLDSDTNLVRAALYGLAVQVLGAQQTDTGMFALRVRGSTMRGAAGKVWARARKHTPLAGPRGEVGETE